MEFDETDEEDLYLANLLKKHYLNDGTYIFTHVTSISGYINDIGYFVDDAGKEYFPLDKEDAFLEQDPYVVADLMTIKEAKEFEEIEEDELEEILYQYNLTQNTKFYLGSIDENLNILTFKFDYESMFSSLYGTREDETTDLEVEEKLKYNRINNIKEAIKNMKIVDNRFKYENGLIRVDSVFKDVTKTVIGQDEPIKRLLAEIARMEMGMQNQAIVLTANSGVGTSMTLRIISRDLNKKLVEIDSTELFEDISNQIKTKLSKLGNTGTIVFFDKLNQAKNKEEISKVINNLIDGTFKNIDTSNMIFIVGGDFCNEKDSSLYNDIPIKIKMNEINVEGLKAILNKSDRSPVIIQKNKFKKIGVDLDFTDKAIDKLATKAVFKKRGAKALEEVVADVTYKPFYKAITNLNKIENITITEKTVDDNNNYKVKIKKQGIN